MCYCCLTKLKKWDKMKIEIAAIQEELVTYLDQSYRTSMTSVAIDTSSVGIKHQSTIARSGDSWDKIGIGITPDPFGGGAYNLQSISATRRKWSGSRD